MRTFIIILVLAGLAGGGVYFAKDWQARQVKAAAPTRATSAKVESRDIRFAVNAAGDIGPADQVSVRPEINGKIAELPVDIGDKVKKNDLLVRLDDADLQIERSQRVTQIEGTQLEIIRAQLQSEDARRVFERTKKLFEEKLLTQEQYDKSKTDFDLSVNEIAVATNALERAKKELRLVEDRLSKTKLLAPFDCTVLTRPVSIGQAVSGSAGFNSGTEIMTIANLNDMVVNAHINQADIVRLSGNQAVDVMVESLPGVKMKGVIERIAPQATIKNSIKGFAVRIQLKEMDRRVRPGMTANLTIPVATADNVLSVPLAAVFTEKGERFVYVKSGVSWEKRNVTIGITDYMFAEVQKGVEDGQEVSLELPAEVREATNGAPKHGAQAQPAKKSVM